MTAWAIVRQESLKPWRMRDNIPIAKEALGEYKQGKRIDQIRMLCYYVSNRTVLFHDTIVYFFIFAGIMERNWCYTH